MPSTLWTEHEVPRGLVPHLEQIVRDQILDANDSFVLTVNNGRPPGDRLVLVAGTDIKKESNLWLVDHAISFTREEEVKTSLQQHNSLRRRLELLLNVESSHPDAATGCLEKDHINMMLRRLWPMVGSYTFSDRDGVPRRLFYVMDEVGSRLQAPNYQGPDAENPSCAAFQCTLVLDRSTGQGYNAFWPIRDVSAGEICTCVGLPHGKGIRLARIQALDAFDHKIGRGLDSEMLEPIRTLRAYLEDRGYNDVGRINRLVGLAHLGSQLLPCWDMSAPHLRLSMVQQIQQHTEGGELVLLVLLFLMGAPVLKEDLEKQCDRTVMRCLGTNGLLAMEGQGRQATLRSTVQLTPVAESSCFFATDFSQVPTQSDFDPVMYVGIDSLGLVHGPRPRKKVRKLLDLCAGCGIQGIVALKRGESEHAFLIDRNPRALRFCRFNAVLNGVEDRVQIHRMDLLTQDSVEQLHKAGPFDVCLANPPYIPNPHLGAALCSFGDGGTDGEHVLHQVIKLLPDLVDQHMSLYAVSNLVNVTSFPLRLLAWWEQLEAVERKECRLQMTICHGKQWSPTEYASLVHTQASTDDPRVQQYADALRGAGVRNVCNAYVLGQIYRRAERETVESKGRVRREDQEGGELRLVRDEAGYDACIVAMHDQIWQVVAMGKEEGCQIRKKLEALCHASAGE